MAQTDVALTEARDEAAQLTTVVASAVALFDRLADLFEGAADDPDEIRAIVATVRSQRESLAQAVAQHTPAEGEEPPVEPPVEPLP
jgi:hypothetical protein